MTPPHFDHVWIASNEALRACCEQLSRVSRIAVDTEFMRSSTFFPKAALFQLFSDEADPQHCYLIDPLAISDFEPLVKLLTDARIVKIFHACSEDLEVFTSFLACVPEPLVDTQLAAGLLSHGPSCSYAALVEAVLGVKLEKGETRSDWLQRPLQSKQIQYAVQDVVYLPALYDALISALTESERRSWACEDCDLLVANAKSPQDLQAFYLRIKSAWKLNSAQLGVLRELSYWREQRARERDMPRNHVVHERVMWNLAKYQPQDVESLKRIEEMDQRTLKRFSKELLEVIARASALPPESLPSPLPAPLPIGARDLMKALKKAVSDKAAALNLSPEVLVRKADFEFIVRSGMEGGEYCLPERLQGWRRQVIGEDLLQVARSAAASPSAGS